MRIAQLDVNLEIPEHDLGLIPAGERDRYVVETLKAKAEDAAEEVGGRVRYDMPPEIRVGRGSHLLFGGDYFLCASRWNVEVPETADVP